MDEKLVQGVLIVQTEKRCSKCKKVKSVAEFSEHKYGGSGLSSWCKKCRSTHNAARQKAIYDPIKYKSRDLMRNYGITYATYMEMFKKQGGVCASCGREETIVSNRSKKKQLLQLAVDHDHVTGKVRSLLCGACNTSLGQLGEDPERIEALLRYARKIQEETESA